jgi:hypothetical protein
VAYDRSRHVIQITQAGDEMAEFDDRPARFLLMDLDPVTKALEPVIIRGEPQGTLGSGRVSRKLETRPDPA